MASNELVDPGVVITADDLANALANLLRLSGRCLCHPRQVPEARAVLLAYRQQMGQPYPGGR